MKRLSLTLFKNESIVTLCIAVIWQLVMTLIGWQIAPEQGFLGHMLHWDAGWYQNILTHAYGAEANPASPAFYPLFPLAVWFTSFLLFGLIPYEASALILNTACLWLILLALIRIGGKFSLTRRGITVMILALLTFPSAFFLHVFYSEALFIAIGLWAYLAALNKQWWLSGVLLALLTASRLPSLLFVALCGLEFLRAHDWNIKKSLNPKILWFLLAPLGMIAYSTYLSVMRDNYRAMFDAYTATSDWTYHSLNFNIFETLFTTANAAAQSLLTLSPTYEVFINYALPLACIVLIAASLYFVWRAKPYGIPLALFGVLSIILFTLNGNVVSVHRYALACLPIFITVGILAKHRKVAYALIALTILSFGVQLFIYTKFINDIFAG